MKDKYIVIENDGEPFSKSTVHFFGSESERDAKFDQLKKKMVVGSLLYKAEVTATAYAQASVTILEQPVASHLTQDSRKSKNGT